MRLLVSCPAQYGGLGVRKLPSSVSSPQVVRRGDSTVGRAADSSKPDKVSSEVVVSCESNGAEIKQMGLKVGRRQSFLQGCALASTLGVAGQFAFEPAHSILARAVEEPPFQLEDPLCQAPAPVPVAASVEEISEGDAATSSPPPPPPPQPSSCLADLSTAEVKSSESGLKYKDLKLGDGEEPPIGYQVVVNYVVMLADGKVVSSTIENGLPADIRVGAGNVVKGIDEGILSMRSGGFRRLYVPGELSFQDNLPSAPGRPRVLAQSSLIVDVNLLYIPGVD